VVFETARFGRSRTSPSVSLNDPARKLNVTGGGFQTKIRSGPLLITAASVMIF
jgi:hypothetical protein